jgi:hypothetical protein
MAILVKKTWHLFIGLISASLFASSAFAAGSVAMQIEHLIRQSIAEYNSAMDEGDSAAYLKYFASNAKYESPVFAYSGRTDLAKHLAAEFKTYKARYKVNRMYLLENTAAILLTWEAEDRNSGNSISIDMVGVYEVGSSGQFSSAVFYFDSARAKALADLAK